MKTTDLEAPTHSSDEPARITRRSFVKRTSATVLVTTLALHAFRHEVMAAEQAASESPVIENYNRANAVTLTTSGAATNEAKMSAAMTGATLTNVVKAPNPVTPLNPKKLMTQPDVSINKNTTPWTYTYTFPAGAFQVQVGIVGTPP